MKDRTNQTYLSTEIELLFDNKKLDALKYLGILYQAKKFFKKRKFNIKQLLYYYSILYYENSEFEIPIIYKYLRDKKQINEIIIYLENLKFIEIQGDIFTDVNNLKISISEKGIDTINSWDSENINLYLEQIASKMKKYPYKENEKRFQKLLREGEF